MLTGVIVWEYYRNFNWINFERSISDIVEDNFSKGYRGNLALPEQQNSATKFYINLFEMTLITFPGGDMRTFFIRRNVYSEDSLAGKGIYWQWLCKTTKSWKDYDLNVAAVIEDASTNEKTDYRVDISLHYPKYNIIVDTQNMTQQEKSTSNVTSIQKIVAPPYISKQVHTSPIQYPPQQPQPNYCIRPVQQVFNQQPMQTHPQMPPNIPLVVAPHMAGLTPSGFVGPPSMPNHQRMFLPNPVNVMPQLSTDGGMPLMTNLRRNTHDASLLTYPYNNYLGTNSNYYGGIGPLDKSQTSQCRMPNVATGDGAGQSQPIPQSFQYYLPICRNQLILPGSRKRNRDFQSMTAGAGVNVIKAENFSTAFSCLVEQGFVICTPTYPSEHCTICFESLDEKSSYCQSNPVPSDLSNVVYFKTCHHHFHLDCLKAMYEAGIKNGSIQCPQCKAIYGIKRGNCPPGEMSYEFWSTSLPGYKDSGTIFIKYNVSGGIQGQDHPNPGKPYSTRGFPRCGYLPGNAEGQKVLRLLVKAWKRRLTFTVGSSVTTGESDTVVWNEIHHKTEEQNSSGHGYPDANYLRNVSDELAAHGVYDSDDE